MGPYDFVIATGLSAPVSPATADTEGTGQFYEGTIYTALEVAVTAPGTYSMLGCACGTQENLTRADVLIGSEHGGHGILTLVNDYAGWREVALRFNELFRVGAPSFNTDDCGYGQLVIGLHTVVIGNDSGGNRFDPNEMIEIGGPESEPAEVRVLGRAVAVDLLTVGERGFGRLDMVGAAAQLSPNGLVIGYRGHGEGNVTQGAVATPVVFDFAGIGNGGELNIFGNGSAMESYSNINVRGSGEGGMINVMNGGRLTLLAPISNPDQSTIAGIGGGVYSPPRINVVYNDMTTDPPLVEAYTMVLRHTHVTVSGPGAAIELACPFQTLSNGHTPTNLMIEDGGQLRCNEFLLKGTNSSDEPDVFTVDGPGSALLVDGRLGIAVGQFVDAEVKAANGANIDAGDVVLAAPTDNAGTRGVLELTGGSQLQADSVDLSADEPETYGVEGRLRVCDASDVNVVGAVTIGPNGILQGSGTVRAWGGVFNQGGTVIAGCSPGKLTIDGDFEQPDGTLVLGVGAGEPSGLTVTGTASIAGHIGVELRDGLLPDSELSLALIEGADVTVDPTTTIASSGLDGLMDAVAKLTPNGVTVDIAPTPGRADLDGDNVTDLDDLTYLSDCLGGPDVNWCSYASIDADEDVDLNDVRIYMLSFGEGQ